MANNALNNDYAEKLAEKYLLNEKTKDGRYLFAHTKGVVLVAEMLAELFNLDKDKMTALAWVHDIGYYLNDPENHAKNSIKLLNEDGISLSDEELDAIANHGTGKLPITKEGKVMQIADKLSIINPDLLKVLLLHNKKSEGKELVNDEEIGFVKFMCDKAIKMLKELKSLK